MFLKCKNCKRVWQYKIEKCPHCFSQLEREDGEKMRVIEIAKVNIPSLFHLKVPYFVLVLEDEKGNRWLQKTTKEYKIGDEIKFEKTTQKEAVGILRVKYDYSKPVEQLTEILGGAKISFNSKILILPTLEKASHPYFKDNTSPEFLDATLKFLFQLGIKSENVKVASQSFDEIPIGAKAQKSGLLQVCQENKVLPLDLSQSNFAKKGDLEISEKVFQADLILNLPILKVGKAQATENLFFLLKKENFLAQKYLYSEKEIFEKLKKEIPEILTIAEANHVRDEKGFTHYLNLILASFSPQNLDRVFFEIISQKDLPEILKTTKIENIPIVGRDLKEIKIYGEK
jgi:uncharacterized OB-fold protein